MKIIVAIVALLLLLSCEGKAPEVNHSRRVEPSTMTVRERGMIAETAAQAVNWGKGFGAVGTILVWQLVILPFALYKVARLKDYIWESYLDEHSDWSDDWSYGISVAIGLCVTVCIAVLILIAYAIGGGK